MFVTLGLITSVPVSAGTLIHYQQQQKNVFEINWYFTALDIVLYGANFAGMKLAGVILIAIGFFLVMYVSNVHSISNLSKEKFNQKSI